MNILVCIKQVPDTTEIKINPQTNTLIRDGVPSILNPFDGYALENAARIKDRNPQTKIVVLTMGPPQSEAVLREALACAADTAYLITDRAFGGSDTLSTSYILSASVRQIEEAEGRFDAIFCGKQAIDGDTAQVGPELAEHLGYPQITSAVQIESVQPDKLTVLHKSDDADEIIATQLPAVITFTKPNFELRFSSIKRWKESRRAAIIHLTAAEIKDIDLNRAGLKGSPTKVKRTFIATQQKAGTIINEKDGATAAQKLFRLLSEAQVL